MRYSLILIAFISLFSGVLQAQKSESSQISEGQAALQCKLVEFDSIDFANKAILKAQSNAIENAFGKIISKTEKLDILGQEQNRKYESKSKFRDNTESNLTGKWIKNYVPPVVIVKRKGKEVWITVKVKGYVKKLPTREQALEYISENLRKDQSNLLDGAVISRLVEDYPNSFFVCLAEVPRTVQNQSTDVSKAKQKAAKNLQSSPLSYSYRKSEDWHPDLELLFKLPLENGNTMYAFVQEATVLDAGNSSSYSQTNPADLMRLKTKFEDVLENECKKGGEGQINFTYKIDFSGLGINRSKIIMNEGLSPVHEAIFEKAAKEADLEPALRDGKWVRTSDELYINLTWAETKRNLRYTGQDSGAFTFFRDKMPYGNYLVSYQDKRFNNRNFESITIKGYNSPGPSSAFLSMLVPGWGSGKVSFNRGKGWLRFSMVAVPLLLSVASELNSRNSYRNYENTITTGNEAKSNPDYKNAQLYHNISLITAGVSVSCYVYDIGWTFFKGSKNNRKKAEIDALVKRHGGKVIKNEPIVF